MRLFKLIITLIILSLVAVFAYENREIWLQTESMKYNLYLLNKTFSVKLYLIVGISLLVGFFVGLSALLKLHFKTRRQLKLERKEKKLAQSAASKTQSPLEPASSSVSSEPGSGMEKEG
ncbi:MAG: LapA family protein [Syntrophobacteraceae bacterium]